MASGRRYKFLGSTFQVQTGFGTAKTITAISQANPAVVTSSAHGFVLGTAVRINSVSGMTELNGNIYAVDNPLTNDFELSGVDATGYAAFSAGSPAGGEAVPVTFSNFCELTSYSQQDGATTEDEVTTICSTAKEFEQGLRDAGTLQMDYNLAGNEPVQAAIRAAQRAGEKLAFKLTLPTTGGTYIMIGSVSQSSFQGSVGAAVHTGSTTIKLSGDIFVMA